VPITVITIIAHIVCEVLERILYLTLSGKVAKKYQWYQ